MSPQALTFYFPLKTSFTNGLTLQKSELHVPLIMLSVSLIRFKNEDLKKMHFKSTIMRFKAK